MREKGWEKEGREGCRKRGSVGSIFRSVTDCVHVFESLRLFICLLPSTPLLIDEEEEEGRHEEEVEIFLMSSVILNFLFSIFTALQSVGVCLFWSVNTAGGAENRSDEIRGTTLVVLGGLSL